MNRATEWIDGLKAAAAEKKARLLQQEETTWKHRDLIARIRECFRGVCCRGEAQVLYGSLHEFLSVRWAMPESAEDISRAEERLHWDEIDEGELLECVEGVHSWGPEATRFLLPAYMILNLSRDLRPFSAYGPLMFCITLTARDAHGEWLRRRFSLFSDQQKQVVQDWFARMMQREKAWAQSGETAAMAGVAEEERMWHAMRAARAARPRSGRVPMLIWEFDDLMQHGDASCRKG